MVNTPSDQSKNILVIGPSWVGDMVMTHALLQRLKHCHPLGTIDVLAPDWSRPLLDRMPEINNAISMPIGHGALQWRKRYQLAHQLRSNDYQQAIVLPNSFKSALIPWFAHIKKRTGWLGECRWGLLNDCRKLNKKKYPLMIERFVALGFNRNDPLPSRLPLPRLTTNPQQVKSVLQHYGLKQGEQPILGLCPGAEFGPAKRWPESHYSAVAKEKLAQGWQVWIFGSKNDQPIAETIQTLINHKAVDLTGRTPLAHAIDLMSVTQQVVTNDSGLMHIAAALDRPLVAIYGSTSADFTPPLNQQARVLQLHLPCSPCFKRECPLGHLHCMTKLTPNTVLAALEELSQNPLKSDRIAFSMPETH
ncbi:MAG: lipopolysaccharide heptosyltransferase II [Gammaproteobacteria bacterium]